VNIDFELDFIEDVLRPLPELEEGFDELDLGGTGSILLEVITAEELIIRVTEEEELREGTCESLVKVVSSFTFTIDDTEVILTEGLVAVNWETVLIELLVDVDCTVLTELLIDVDCTVLTELLRGVDCKGILTELFRDVDCTILVEVLIDTGCREVLVGKVLIDVDCTALILDVVIAGIASTKVEHDKSQVKVMSCMASTNQLIQPMTESLEK